MPLRVVFFGTPQFAVPCLQALLDDERFEVLGCVTQPDKRRGRGNKTTPSPVKAIALDHDLTVWQPARIKKDPDTLAQLTALQADCFVVVAYGQILSKQILDMPRLGCVNVHGSLLPKYRGAAPIQWSIVHGQAETGVTTMQMDEGMDTGDMLQVAKMPIGPEDTAWSIAERMAALGADTLIKTLVGLDAGELNAIPQSEADASYAPLIKKPDYVLDWSKSALALHNQVRGFYPSCNSTFRGDALKILETVPLDQADPAWSEALQPLFESWQASASSRSDAPNHSKTPASRETPVGSIIATLKNGGPVIQTGDGALLLKQVKPAGKKAMSGWDFVNGLRVETGEMLGSQN